MSMKTLIVFVGLLFTSLSYSQSSGADRSALAEKYPNLTLEGSRDENKKILCPFLRMLERAGLFDAEKEKQSDLTVGILKIARAAREFACSQIACGGVAAAVSAGQVSQLASKPGAVNLEALHTAVGVAHECGLTFAKGGQVVSDEVRSQTLQQLRLRSDDAGRLSFADLEAVKLDICRQQGVEITTPGAVEIALIYSFLGGQDRGFIEYSDLELFLNARLPETIGKPSASAP